MQNSCTVHIFLMEKHRKLLSHKKIGYDKGVCLDLDLKSFGQVRGHWLEKCKMYVRSISFLWKNTESSYFTQSLLLKLGSVITLTKGHLAFVTDRKKCQNLCSVHIFLIEKHWQFLFQNQIAYYVRVTLGHLGRVKITDRKSSKSMSKYFFKKH